MGSWSMVKIAPFHLSIGGVAAPGEADHLLPNRRAVQLVQGFFGAAPAEGEEQRERERCERKE